MLNKTESPLLLPQNIEQPLEVDYLADAAAFMDAAGVEPDRIAQEALGYYWRSRREKAIASPASSSTSVGQRISQEFDAILDGLHESPESDLLASLVTDYAAAKAATNSDVERSKDVFGFKARKAMKARIEGIREAAGIERAFSVTEFTPGDEVRFYSEMPPNLGKATAVLEGTVIELQGTEFGPAVVIEVQHERRKGDMRFIDEPRKKGATVRLIGSVLWNNSYRKEPSMITQGNVLEFLDVNNRPIVPGQVLQPELGSRADRYGRLQLQLMQVAINDTDVFPPHSWSDKD